MVLSVQTPRGRGSIIGRSLRALVAGSLSMPLLLASPGFAMAASDSQGSEFWLAFPGNLGAEELTLFLTGSSTTTGTVSIPSLSFSESFSITPGTVSSVAIPLAAQLETSNTVEDLGIHVTSGAEISVYGLNRVQFTTDAYLGLPVDILGTSYIALGFGNVDVNNGTQLAVVGTQAGTTVNITPTVATDGHAAGTTYAIALGQGQTYQLRNTDSAPADLSGTIITADKPIAVFGGQQCANIPDGNTFACDHVVEQLPPTTTWGKSFVSMPLATRVGGDTFRIVASQSATTVTINGATAATLGAGQVHQQIIDGPARISSDKPILVAQYSNGSTFDDVVSDPFMMLIPPFEQFLASYTVTTPATGFSANYINLVVPDGAVGSVALDGTAVPAASYSAIGSSGFKGAQVSVALGSHTLSGPLPFGAFMYGFAEFDSYGYPGGFSLAPIALVTSVTLTPESATNPVGTEHCVEAAVADQNGAALSGVRVDFAVTGVNPTSGFVNSSALGVAEFCFTGTAAGTDTITASVGSIMDTATKTWTSGPNPPPSVDAGAAATGAEGSPISLVGTATDDGSLTTGWSFLAGAGVDAGATCSFGSPAAPSTTITCTDDGTYTATLTANDGSNDPVSDGTTVTVSNAAPSVTITAPADTSVVNLGTTVNLSATFVDAGSNDTHACSIDWGDATTVGVVAGGICTGSHSHAAIGSYAVTVTVTDDDGAVGTASIILVVSDRTVKVTGGGFVTTNGRSSFGFVAKEDEDGLHGQLQLRTPGNLRFHGVTVTSLTVNANTATWTGSGRWDGVDGYTFEVAVIDNRNGGGRKGTPDTIIVTVRDATNAVVFTTAGPLMGGNITVH